MEEGFDEIDAAIDDDIDENRTDDIAAKVTSNSHRNERTALNHFKRFVATTDAHGKIPFLLDIDGNIESITLDQLSNVEASRNLISYFSSYLIKIAKVPKAGGTLQYVSKVKSYLVKRFPAIDSLTFEAGGWYKNLRQNVFKEYLNLCMENGSELRKPHNNMSSKEHSYVGKTLFGMDKRSSHMNRSVIKCCIDCILLHFLHFTLCTLYKVQKSALNAFSARTCINSCMHVMHLNARFANGI